MKQGPFTWPGGRKPGADQLAAIHMERLEIACKKIMAGC